MKLTSLLKFLHEKKFDFELLNFDGKEIEISGVCDDSRKAKKGNLFVAIKGLKYDSHQDIQKIQNKVSVIITDKNFHITDNNNVYLRVNNTRDALSLVSSWWFKNPSSKLKLIAVTGTKGKTTSANIIYQILKENKYKVGLVSTVGAKIGNINLDTGLHVTNPEPLLLQKILRKMVDNKIEYAVLEVSSHGIDQGRVWGLEFDVAVFTNITREHLDYHKTFESYKNTKLILIGNSKIIVANKDDQSFEDIKKASHKNGKEMYSYSIVDENSDYFASNLSVSKNTNFSLKTKSKSFPITTNLNARYNISNLLAAVGTASLLGVKTRDIAKTIKVVQPIEGRLEEIPNKKGFQIFIDFAHTPESMEAVLSHLKSKKSNSQRLITVFGCAGERDRQKRSKMGTICETYSDISVLTAEDPRSESVVDINKEIKKGIKFSAIIKPQFGYNLFNPDPNKKSYTVIPDRSEAINWAIKIARKGDIVAILGKGHEKSMNYDGFEHPWSDKQSVLTALNINPQKFAVVMAAGKGTRLKSDLPKVLHKLAGKSMISYTLKNLRSAGFGTITVVVGYEAGVVMNEIGPGVCFAYQKKQLGTGHAAWQGIKEISKIMKMKHFPVLVMNGDDTAFYNPKTFNRIMDLHTKTNAFLTFTSCILEDPTGIGRLVRDETGKLLRIVEEKAATDDEKKIKETNINMFVFDNLWFLKNIQKVKKAQVGEYYITDMVEIAIQQKIKMNVFELKNRSEWFGVNTPEQLLAADARMKKSLEQ